MLDKLREDVGESPPSKQHISNLQDLGLHLHEPSLSFQTSLGLIDHSLDPPTDYYKMTIEERDDVDVKFSNRATRLFTR